MKKLMLLSISVVTATLPLSGQLEVGGNGDVGIGMIAPDAKLAIRGENVALSLGRSLADGNGYARLGFTSDFVQYVANNAYWDGLVWNYVNPSGYGGVATRFVSSHGAFNFDTVASGGNPINWNSRLHIANNGNVGMGTASPGAKLHTYIASGDHFDRIETGSTNSTGIEFKAASISSYIYQYAGSGDIRLHAGASDRLVVQPGGNVGIGTATPAYKVEVAGAVRATSFISNTTTYADFVFDPGYELPALSEVEAHIQEHGHLPGIPSEAEARAQGIDLAAMQVKLLQKIEELTLHQIQQGKHLARLEADNVRQRDELIALRRQQTFPSP